jgi:hypothetical protein
MVPHDTELDRLSARGPTDCKDGGVIVELDRKAREEVVPEQPVKGSALVFADAIVDRSDHGVLRR